MKIVINCIRLMGFLLFTVIYATSAFGQQNSACGLFGRASWLEFPPFTNPYTVINAKNSAETGLVRHIYGNKLQEYFNNRFMITIPSRIAEKLNPTECYTTIPATVYFDNNGNVTSINFAFSCPKTDECKVSE